MSREVHVRACESPRGKCPRATRPVVGFQHEHEALAFLEELKERLRLFDLTLHPRKTRLIRFGRFAARQCRQRGEGKPETFDFLGFTHFCTRSRNGAKFVLGRRTIKKRMREQLKVIKTELRRRLHGSIGETGCQSAPNIDPLPACKIDPSFSCSSAACRGGVEPLGGTPERQAAVRRHERFLKRQLSLPVSMISQ